MKADERQQSGKEHGEAVFTTVAHWRQAHPQATLAQIEQTVDEQINGLRAQMIQEAAQVRAAASNEVVKGRGCEQCGQARHSRGRGRRRWQTQGGKQVEGERTSVPCPQCGGGFFPLEKELEVPDGHRVPHAQQTLVRLRSQLPFACACKDLQTTLGVQVQRATAPRHTLAVGRRCLQVQTQQAEPGGACPEEPTAERLSMSSAGAMVPLVGGRWAERKRVARGGVEQGTGKRKGEAVTRHLSYFARMTAATTFADQASAEIRRRGVERATEVCALQDGAEWITGFVDSQRHAALRILDFAHAAASLSELAQLLEAGGGQLPAKWLEGVLHRLKHDGPDRLLRHVSRLAVRYPQVQEQVTSLQKRTEQMDDPTYQKHGWPSGESVGGKRPQRGHASPPQGGRDALAP